MTGYSGAYTPHSITGTIQVASDTKEDQSGLASWTSAASIIAMVLVIALVLFLTIELAWRERRQRSREERTEPVSEPDPHTPHMGETPP
ncbi:hypothetical protein [Streptomyces anulatus]|uniref:hypothetical protein n=1 Tax=Streptomyces anulatus TaxID=1892 RepID=UPI0004CB1161|nr:hypothetical protein [Streptomyces anulatus]